MREACSTHGKNAYICNVERETGTENTNLKTTPRIKGKAILKRILKKSNARCELIDVVHDRNQWRALVGIVMNLEIP